MVALLEAKLGKAVPASRPQLRVVGAPAPANDDGAVRESRLRMIRSLRKHYRALGMDLLVAQALLGRASLDDLTDDELAQLHRDMERGLECIRDDVSFEDAGLLRHGTGD